MKHWFIASCLALSAAVPLAAQTNFTPVNIGSVNVGSSITTTVTMAAPSGSIWRVDVSNIGNTFAGFSQSGGTCVHLTQANPCTVNVTFTPLHGGTRFGAVTLTDVYGNTISSQLIAGTGNAPESSFSPGFEFSLGTVPNPSAIALTSSGRVYVPVSGYGQGDSAVKPGLYSISHYDLLTYSAPEYKANLSGPGVWTDAIGNGYFNDANFQPFHFSKNFGDTRLNLSVPAKLVGDLAGNLFVIKPGGNTVYKETPTAIGHFTNGIQSYAETTFATGSDIWSDWFGNVFVLNNTDVFKYMLQPDGTYVQTRVLQSLSSNLTVDGYGNIYGSVDGGTTLHKEILQPNGAYVLTDEIPVGDANPGHLTVDDDGNLFYDKLVTSATTNAPEYRAIMKEDFSQTPILTFASTDENSTSSDSGKVVTITNRGNIPLQFSNVIFPIDFPHGSAAAGECAAGTSLLGGESCPITINFHPVTPLNASNTPATRNEVVKVITNTLNNPSTEQDIQVSGLETIGPAAMPVFSPVAGTYDNTQWVAITSATPGAKIYYTYNGTTPTTASMKYTGPVAVRNSFTLRAIAVASGSLPSAIASSTYSLAVSAPTVSLAAGTYTGAQTVSITTNSANAMIFYTLNGSTPSGHSTRYTGPITISASKTLKVIAIATGYTPSQIVTNAYTIH